MRNIKYIRYGHDWNDAPVMCIVVMTHTEYGSWKVEVFPTDTCGSPVSDAIGWDIFPQLVGRTFLHE